MGGSGVGSAAIDAKGECIPLPPAQRMTSPNETSIAVMLTIELVFPVTVMVAVGNPPPGGSSCTVQSPPGDDATAV